MRTLAEVALLVDRAGEVEIRSWVERGWVAVEQRGPDQPLFSDLDVARVCLICDLRRDLAVDEETIPLVLSLLDQIYGLRRRLHVLADAVQQEPEEVRRAILRRASARRTPEAPQRGRSDDR